MLRRNKNTILSTDEYNLFSTYGGQLQAFVCDVVSEIQTTCQNSKKKTAI